MKSSRCLSRVPARRSGWLLVATRAAPGSFAAQADEDPVSPAGGGTGLGGAHYDPALHQDGAAGRFFKFGMSYSF